jgi:hypothetical protein
VPSQGQRARRHWKPSCPSLVVADIGDQNWGQFTSRYLLPLCNRTFHPAPALSSERARRRWRVELLPACFYVAQPHNWRAPHRLRSGTGSPVRLQPGSGATRLIIGSTAREIPVSRNRAQVVAFTIAASLMIAAAVAGTPIYLAADPPKAKIDSGPSLSLGRVGPDRIADAEYLSGFRLGVWHRRDLS